MYREEKGRIELFETEKKNQFISYKIHTLQQMRQPKLGVLQMKDIHGLCDPWREA
jgi:hypothetical protein